jgi:FemAB-related protein (PEP-CTERM system-associated)
LTAIQAEAVFEREQRPVAIKPLASGDEARWDAFVDSSEQGTFFHRAGWKRVIEEGLGHRTFYLYAENESGNILGVLPLTFIRSLLFGRSLSSTAFCVYGGPAAADAGVAEALAAQAVVIGNKLRAEYVELRSRRPTQQGWQQKTELYATFRKLLSPDSEENLLAVPRKQRAMVRKGIAAGLVSSVEQTADGLYALYAESVRNLGTPVFPKRYFRVLLEVFGSDCEVLIVRHLDRPVSGVLSFFFKDEVLPYYGGGTRQAREVAANDFMYWEVMRRAVDRGCRLFDFGRSKVGTGSFSFKTHWGFTPEPLSYEYRLLRTGEVPDVNPLNPKYKLLIDAWKRLPLPVANFLGPWIARDLG